MGVMSFTLNLLKLCMGIKSNLETNHSLYSVFKTALVGYKWDTLDVLNLFLDQDIVCTILLEFKPVVWCLRSTLYLITV